MFRRLVMTGLIAGSFLTASAASASTVVTNQWYTFGFSGAGSSLTSGASFVLGTNPSSLAAPDPTWDITLASAATLIVVDGFNSGDQFSISDFGSLLGPTSVPVLQQSCGSDITCALNNPAFSRGSFALGAGAHSITGSALLSPFGGGAGFFQISTAAVPEPSTWALMLIGFGAIGFSMRLRKNAGLQPA